MSDILKEWLIHQLGLEIHSVHPDNICYKFKNGFLIGKILQSYNVVSSLELLLLADEEDEEIKKSNFQYLNVWLKTINVSLDNDTVDGIISGETSVIYAFLYKLCLVLESPNNLNLTRYAKQVYKSFGSFEFLSFSDTHDNTNILKSFSSHKFISKDELSFCKTHRNYNLNTFYDELDEFERSLPEKLKRWSIRGDQSSTR